MKEFIRKILSNNQMLKIVSKHIYKKNPISISKCTLLSIKKKYIINQVISYVTRILFVYIIYLISFIHSFYFISCVYICAYYIFVLIFSL